MVLWLKKVIEGDMSHVKSYHMTHIISYESYHMSHITWVICMRNRDGSISKWLKISIMCFYWDGSLFWVILVFMIEKFSHLSKKTRDRDFEPFWNWAISNRDSRFLMHMTSRETWLLRWLFEPSHHTIFLRWNCR